LEQQQAKKNARPQSDKNADVRPDASRELNVEKNTPKAVKTLCTPIPQADQTKQSQKQKEAQKQVEEQLAEDREKAEIIKQISFKHSLALVYLENIYARYQDFWGILIELKTIELAPFITDENAEEIDAFSKLFGEFTSAMIEIRGVELFSPEVRLQSLSVAKLQKLWLQLNEYFTFENHSATTGILTQMLKAAKQCEQILASATQAQKSYELVAAKQAKNAKLDAEAALAGDVMVVISPPPSPSSTPLPISLATCSELKNKLLEMKTVRDGVVIAGSPLASPSFTPPPNYAPYAFFKTPPASVVSTIITPQTAVEGKQKPPDPGPIGTIWDGRAGQWVSLSQTNIMKDSTPPR
jgi:hypothetical protein